MDTSFEPGSPGPAGTIPLCVPELRGNEWNYVKECLDTGWVSSVGGFVDRFEKSIAKRVDRKFSVAAVNGTAAIHIALLVAGVRPDDEVLLPTLTFVAPANAVRYVNAWPIFIDAEPLYWQMDVEKLHSFLRDQCVSKNGGLHDKQTGRRVSAILPVHILGHPVDMDPILELAQNYGLSVIEDATESLGAKYKNRSVGNLGDIACFSFNGNKIITAGGGGMLVTDNEDWADRAKYLTTQAKDDPVEYVHHSIGYNYRLTNVQAAIGCAQMENLDNYIRRKREIAAAYKSGLSGIPGLIPMAEAPWAFSIFWMFTIMVDPAKANRTSRQLLMLLKERRIQTRPLWQPMHKSPAHNSPGTSGFETADALYANALSLPCSVGISNDQIAHVCEQIASVLSVPK